MKKYHLIILATALFINLFYAEDFGLNFGILAIVYAVLKFFETPKKNRTKTFNILFLTSILSAFAFAFYGDFVSFVAIIASVLLLSFKGKNRNMNLLLTVPVFIVNGFTFICRLFNFNQWLPVGKVTGIWQKLIAFILIPGIFLAAFFGIYAQGSEKFAHFFDNWEFNLDVWQLIVLTCLGFFLAFNYFNFTVGKFFYKSNHYFKNDFLNREKTVKPTYSFLDLNFERSSGVITFLVLNVLLLFFIITYNYEQFYEVQKLPHQLSEATHKRVYAVIFSIVMAVFVILFYFKSSFNFDEKAGLLKILAKIWLFMNGVLMISAIFKNTEYILELGLTYKRFGVFAFLILCIVGLIYAFIKIKKQKTNAYLINQMFWYVYGTILAASFINWGNLATVYNINNGKGDFTFLNSLNYNDEILIEKFPNEVDKTSKEKSIETEQNKSFLSQFLYWQTINLNKK